MSAISPLSTNASSSAASAVSGALNNGTIAGNFTTFLKLLTTQLQNQNPLDPLDTNQFTQQLVEFAQVEQQLKSNDQLSTLVSLQQAAQSTNALALVGATVVVNGSTAQLANGSANWTLTRPSRPPPPSRSPIRPAKPPLPANTRSTPAARTSPGAARVMTARFAGRQLHADCYRRRRQRPAFDDLRPGAGAGGSVDLTQTPPVLSINGQNYQLSQIQKIVRSGV